MKRKTIIVTDGDKIAQKAVEKAATNIGGRCISLSAGNPTVLSGKEIVELIKTAKHDPVVVMVDDRGDNGIGKGEEAMNVIMNNKDIDVMGIVAVASNTPHALGVKVDCSIDNEGRTIGKAVDKYGTSKDSKILTGDTVNMLGKVDTPYVVGIGDPGKMDGKDDYSLGAPIITKALEKIIEYNASH